ncbi:T9SS type A sorting domain-containing protein [Chryseobacterium sp. MEBOG06]|uniref:T9SS type A sorting domain-containing protein n=1 Tax=unclassified Chryseobacterium TaxID=2593645 RepID=UPI001F25B8CC|nr:MULTISPECIES: T9SS type A sorting domain-containing protein [unclassified Chryseobacterium]UKB81825.1 T9SS type A sorting domain-containing protein [Chryseobacterium sp. MEBOG06]
MKKHYSFVLILFSILSFAQQIISFEDAEGFSPIDVNGQVNWISTPTGGIPANVTNQVISTDNASDGIRSLKIVKESTYGTQTDPIIGGFYNLQTPISFADFSISFEINMSQRNGSVFGFQAVDSTEEQFAVRVDFDKTGVVKILDMISGTQTLISLSEIWTQNIWYKCRIVGTATDIKYYLNNTLIYTGSAATVDISQLRFVHNNALGSAYIDNIVITNGVVLGVNDLKTNTKLVSLYPNPASDFIKINSQNKIKNVMVYDLNGRRIDVKRYGDEIDVRNLSAGEYLLTIETDGRSSTEKFIKK